MTKEELIKGLTECGVKKKDIEVSLGMPKNSLSGMISGSKPIPEKWFVLLESFIENKPNPNDTALINFASNVSINTAIQQIKEEETTFQGFVELVNPQTEPQKPEKIVLPKARGIMLGADYLADVPKTTFQKLLIQFNLLVEEQPPVKDIEVVLYDLIEKSSHPDLTPRQSEAIRERCINYLTGQYGTKSKK